MRALEQITRKTHSEKDSIRAIPSSTVEAMLIQSNLMERPPRQPLLTFPLFMRTGLVSLLTLGGAFVPFAWENSQGASLAEARTALVNVSYLSSCFTSSIAAGSLVLRHSLHSRTSGCSRASLR